MSAENGRTYLTSAPEWWPPQSGDVAMFWECVEGGVPYRVCVSYNHSERAWMNVGSGGVLPRQPYPGDLTMLVRDGAVYLYDGTSPPTPSPAVAAVGLPEEGL